jgi:hypothetical protein
MSTKDKSLIVISILIVLFFWNKSYDMEKTIGIYSSLEGEMKAQVKYNWCGKVCEDILPFKERSDYQTWFTDCEAMCFNVSKYDTSQSVVMEVIENLYGSKDSIGLKTPKIQFPFLHDVLNK